MDKILNLDNVDQYNSLYGLETLNPLVSVIDLNKATRQMDYVHWNYGVYALYLKLEKACDIKYGRRSYVSIRPRACFFPLFSFLPLWLHYNLNPLCVQY